MPNFRQNSTVRNYLSRREQWRILMLVMSLGLAVLAMREAAKPSNWTWIWAGAKQSAPQNEPAQNQKVDNRLRPREELGPGVVRIAAKRPLPEGTDADDFFPGVDIELLGEVRDDENLMFLPDEDNPQRKAWFHLIDILNRTDEATLAKASTGKVTYAQLFKSPQSYRGKLVTVHGYVRRALPQKVPKNDRGIEEFYRIWMSVDRTTTAVCCLQLPEGFPTGARVSAEVEITGFFFKRLAYAHRPLNPDEEGPKNKMSLAPLLLAKTVRWIPKKPVVATATPSTEYLLAALGAALLCALVFTWWVFSRDHQKSAEPQLGDVAASLARVEQMELPADVPESIEAIMKRQEETPR